ncbi:MAG: hypothetical protein PUD93_07445 [Lachnospiraceae bacterium]|nr:hypothetical protein [Lachnospiraceae bacterium]
MKFKLKIFPIILSFIISVTFIFQYSFVSYAKPYYSWDEVAKDAETTIYYMLSQLRCMASGDFVSWLQNKDSWKEYWNQDNVLIDEETGNITFSQDLVSVIKQALISYEESTQGLSSNDVRAQWNGDTYNYHASFYFEGNWGTSRVHKSDDFTLSSNTPKAIVYSAEDIYENGSLVYSFKIYHFSYNSFAECDFNDNYTYDSKSGTKKSSGVWYTVGGNYYTDTLMTYSANFPIFSNVGDAETYLRGTGAVTNALNYVSQNNRTVYYGANFVNTEPQAITVNYEVLEAFDTTKIESLLEDIKNEIGNTDSLTEEEIQHLVDTALEKYFDELKNIIGPGGGSSSGSSGESSGGTTEIIVNTDTGFFSEWFQKILDKLDELKNTLSEKLNDVKLAIDALLIRDTISDVIDEIDESKDDAINNATDLVGDIIESFGDDDIELEEKGNVLAGDIVKALSGTTAKLKTKFPFSIPWDMLYLVELLEAEPEAPIFNLPIVLPRYGIEEYIVIDMSQYQIFSYICRSMLTIMYCYGLLNLTIKVLNIGKEV